MCVNEELHRAGWKNTIPLLLCYNHDVSKVDKTFNIHTYIKHGKDMVIELDDDVECIVHDPAIGAIDTGKRVVELIRVIDRKPVRISTRRIKWSLLTKGVIDYLDKTTHHSD